MVPFRGFTQMNWKNKLSEIKVGDRVRVIKESTDYGGSYYGNNNRFNKGYEGVVTDCHEISLTYPGKRWLILDEINNAIIELLVEKI